jgi:hypothetical protein
MNVIEEIFNKMDKKRQVVRVSWDLHHEMKKAALDNMMTIQNWLDRAIRRDLQKYLEEKAKCSD